MRGLIATTLILFAASAARAEDAAPAAVAEPPTCTITTVVVKKGDVVLSSNTSTRCLKPGEKPGDSFGGGVIGGVASVPGAVLKPFLNGPSLLASPPDMEMTHMTGVWQTARGPRKSCQVILMREITALGRGVRAPSCTGVLGQAKGWKVEDKDVVLLGQDGAELARLQGDRARISGAAVDGEQLVLQR